MSLTPDEIYEQQNEIIKNRYRDLYSTDIDTVKHYLESSTLYKNLIVPDVVVGVNNHYHDKDFIYYMKRLPSEQLTMVMRYQNIIQNDKYIQRYLSRKKQSFDIPELFELKELNKR